MSKDKHIDNISEKVWNAYFSGVILTSEKERVEAFLKQFPEFEEEFRSVSAADAISISEVTKNVNARISAKYGVKKSPVLWVGIVATIAVVVIVVLTKNNITVNEISNNNEKENAVTIIDSTEKQIADSDKVNVEESIDDTIFFFERKGNDIEVEELVVEVKDVIYPEYVAPEVESDTGMILDKEDEKIQIQKTVYQKSFTTSIDYRQTVHVEDNFYSQSKTMGKTSSYASPIKGYTYEMEGMPAFKGGDKGLVAYIENGLSQDELLKGKSRKMKASLSFVITNKGKIKDVLVQNCNHKQFGMSLMQIMESMPDWDPSEFKGKKGKAHYVLKIVFE